MTLSSDHDAGHSVRIVAAARRWIGTPYLHQASLIGVGCDCLGLLRGVWRDIYGHEPELPPPYAPDWAEAGHGEPMAEAASRHLLAIPIDDAQPGDLLLFRWREGIPAKHCAVLSGPGEIIHAHEGAAVCAVSLSHWRRRIAFAFRFPPLPAA